MNSKHYTYLNAILTSLIAIVFFVTGIYAFYEPSAKETIALATTQQPEKLTELYLENHLQLPKDNTINKVHSFSFTIHNLEYQPTTYPYEVFIEASMGAKMIFEDSVTLGHDEKRTIPITYVLTEPIERGKVTVNLKNKNQAIHFWIGENK